MLIAWSVPCRFAGLLGFILVCLLANPATSQAKGDPAHGAQDVVRYSLDPLRSSDGLSGLSVGIEFDADPSGTTMVNLPDAWAGREALWRNLDGFEVEGGQILPSSNPAQLTIASQPGSRLTLRYKVTSGLMTPPSVDDEQPTVPWILPDWFYVNGETIFAIPRGRLASAATFEWNGPASMPFVSDLAHLDGTDRSGVRPGTVRDIRRSAMLGGAGVRSVTVGQTTLGLHGAFAFEDRDLAAEIDRILVGERRFWNEGEPMPMVVTLAALGAEHGVEAYAGNGRDDGFAMAATSETPLEDLRWFLAHEIFHTWNPRVLGARAPTGDGPGDLWFVEGFTDFFARRILLDEGLFSADAFVASWNAILLDYANNTERSAADGGFVRRPVDPSTTEALDYVRGALIAAVLEANVREVSSGQSTLADVVRRQRTMAQNDPTESVLSLFFKAAAAYGIDPETQVHRYLQDHQEIVLPDDAFGTCFTVGTVIQPVFDRGFDADATLAAGGVLTGVEPDGPAYRAGLRNGMRLLRLVEGRPGDARTRYTIAATQEGSSETLVSFMPEGQGTLSLQQLSVAPSC